ncbi:MAG: hypothetical protein ACTHJM_11865 [Marmoricola sp.]
MSPLAYSIKAAAEASGLSVSALDRAIRAGQLRAKSSSEDEDGNPTGKRLILARELERYLESLVDC